MTLSSHASRWLIAAIAAPVLIWLIFFAPPAFFYVFVGLAGLGAWWEFHLAVLGREDPYIMVAAFLGWGLTAAGAALAGITGLASGLVFAAAVRPQPRKAATIM